MSGQAADGSAPDKDLLISVLMTEYQNLHARVFNQINSYESNMVKTFMLYGVLLYFGGIHFTERERLMQLYVDALFIVVFPVLAIAVVLVTAAHMKKIMLMGDLLKNVENKANAVLEADAAHFRFVGARVMGWEFCRNNCGYASTRNAKVDITLASCISVLLFVISVIAPFLRISYLDRSDPLPLAAAAFALVLALLCLLVFSARGVFQKRNETREISQDNRIDACVGFAYRREHRKPADANDRGCPFEPRPAAPAQDQGRSPLSAPAGTVKKRKK